MSVANELAPPESLRDWRSAVDEAARVFSRGEVIPRAWLEAAFGFDADADTMQFLNALGCFKERLLERHRMDLVAEGSFDQKILLARDQADRAVSDHAREYLRSRAKVERRTRNVAEGDLSAQERTRLNDTRARLAVYLEATTPSLEGLVQTALPTGDEEG